MAKMQTTLVQPTAADLAELSELCLRSKGYWGYDTDFLDACRSELTLTEADLSDSAVIAACVDETFAGLAQVRRQGRDADLDKLFIDPPFIKRKIGEALFNWCVDEARKLRANRLMIDADPDAAPFYQRMGARLIGDTPSASIPGRRLPQLEYSLK